MRTRAKLLLVTALLLGPGWALAQVDAATAVSNNTSLTYHRTSNHLPLVLQWRVEGRGDLWVFPAGGDLTFRFKNDHFHVDSHVGGNQIHAQGVLDGPGIPAGQVLVGVIYTAEGNAPDTGLSVISEKLEILNNSASDITLDLIGMGMQASDDEYAGPALTDLSALQTVIGSSITFVQKGLIATTPFGPLAVSRFASFRGFNPRFAIQRVTLHPGETVTMITELNLAVFARPAVQAPTTQ